MSSTLDKTDLLWYLDPAGQVRPVTRPEDWPRRREQILGHMQEVMGPFPGQAGTRPPEVEVLETVRLPGLSRQKIAYQAEADDWVPAYLLVPEALRAPAPAVLCLHQTTALGKGEPAGLGDNPDMRYGLELARRGYLVLAPDYPYFGDYACDPYRQGYASATMKGIVDHVRGVDLLQSLPQVDRERIGCLGHSLGGHNSVFLAAFEPRIAVVVSSCGFNAFAKHHRGDLTAWSSKYYMPRIASAYGKDPQRMPFDFPEVVAALAPRPFFASAPLRDSDFDISGVYECLRAAQPVYDLLGAPDHLAAVHPDLGHEFPDGVRQQAYAFVDRFL